MRKLSTSIKTFNTIRSQVQNQEVGRTIVVVGIVGNRISIVFAGRLQRVILEARITQSVVRTNRCGILHILGQL